MLLYLEDEESSTEVYCSPRVGLDLASYKGTSLDDPRLRFLARNYRFIASPQLLKVNGRHYTFLAVCKDLEDDAAIERAALLMGIKADTARQYARSYISGTQQDAQRWIGRKAIGKAGDCLEMLGATSAFSQHKPDAAVTGDLNTTR
jgi:hypothetical protein